MKRGAIIILALAIICSLLILHESTFSGMANLPKETGTSGPQSTVDWWPMFHHDLTHGGYSTSPAPNTNQTIWTYKTGCILSSPAVSDGIVYVGADKPDYNFYALNASTGALIWNYTMGGGTWSCPAVSQGIVYVGSLDHKLYALDASTGVLVWSYTTGSYIEDSSPAVAYGKVYIGSDDGRVYALNSLNGALVWNYSVASTSSVTSSPAVANGLVYVGSMYTPSKIYALNAFTGAPVWNYTPGSNVGSSPVVAGGMVYVGSMNDNLYALDASTGAVVWIYTTGGGVSSSPAVAYNKVFVGSSDNRVYALDASTGTLAWSYKTGAGVFSSPAVADGKIYVGSADSRVYALDASTGALVWSYLTSTVSGDVVDSSPAVANGRVYVGAFDGNLFAFGALTLSASISPSSVTMNVGQSQLFTSNAIGGTMPYTYQWYLNGTSVSGANSPTWTFTPSSPGSYTAYVVVNDSTSPSATVQSNNASISTISPAVYIMNDGSVVPSYAPISSLDNVTYAFTGNVSYPTYSGIVVERNNIVVDGNGQTLQGNYANSGNGLSFMSVSNVTVKNTTVEGFSSGIYLYSSSNDTVSGNTLTANLYDGVFLYYSSNNTVNGNDASSDGDGIYLYYSNCNTVSWNNVTANNFAGIHLSSSNNNTLIGNTATSNRYEGISLSDSSDDNTIDGNIATGSFAGIYLIASSNNTISRSSFSANDDGVYLDNSSNTNTVSGNTIIANHLGFSFYSSFDNTVSGNNVTANDYSGIWLYSSSNNILHHNNFINNAIQASSQNSTNTWDNGYPSGGNYWSDYHGTDSSRGPFQNMTGSDGIGDTPYVINPNNTDHYPLMGLYSTNSLSVTISPDSATLIIGNSQAFTSAVSGGTLTYAYQWCLNGNPVPGATSATWTFVPTSAGSYTVCLNVTDNVGAYETSNVADITVNNLPSFHDIAVTNITSSKTVIGQGYEANITITVQNQGNFTESFNVTTYANTTAMITLNFNLTSGSTETTSFLWSTNGLAYGNYTLSIYAWPVSGESNTINNNYTCPYSVHIGVPGDTSSSVQGVYDKIVNIRDIAYLVSLFNSKPNSPNWNPNGDVNNDGIVNMKDLSIAIAYFNQHE
jgi:parallel beta-helix repeat protein